jgi:hypothetical protein
VSSPTADPLLPSVPLNSSHQCHTPAHNADDAFAVNSFIHKAYRQVGRQNIGCLEAGGQAQSCGQSPCSWASPAAAAAAAAPAAVEAASAAAEASCWAAPKPAGQNLSACAAAGLISEDDVGGLGTHKVAQVGILVGALSRMRIDQLRGQQSTLGLSSSSTERPWWYKVQQAALRTQLVIRSRVSGRLY